MSTAFESSIISLAKAFVWLKGIEILLPLIVVGIVILVNLFLRFLLHVLEPKRENKAINEEYVKHWDRINKDFDLKEEKNQS